MVSSEDLRNAKVMSPLPQVIKRPNFQKYYQGHDLGIPADDVMGCCIKYVYNEYDILNFCICVVWHSLTWTNCTCCIYICFSSFRWDAHHRIPRAANFSSISHGVRRWGSYDRWVSTSTGTNDKPNGYAVEISMVKSVKGSGRNKLQEQFLKCLEVFKKATTFRIYPNTNVNQSITLACYNLRYRVQLH